MSSSSNWIEGVRERDIPNARLGAIGWLVLVLVVASMILWELQMRSLGLRAGDLDDSKASWSVERRKIATGDHDGIAIVGGSRILFDTDLDVWQAVSGRRPVQLALAGMSGQRFLADLANHSEFAGLVVIDVTPEQFFREGPGNPEFEGVLDMWDQQGPAERFGHRVGLFLSRHLAFLDDQYTLGKFIDQLDIPNRDEVIGPYLRPWKLSETFDDRQTFLWKEIQTDEWLRGHAVRVWLAGPARGRPPPGDDLIARVCADVRASVVKIRARGGDVAFIRPPSTGAYYEREQRRVPRARSWDRLLRESGAFGIHFEDFPEMQDLELPELSHLSRDAAARYTRIYAGVLVKEFPWLKPAQTAEQGA
jgi:hypothetical protein